MSRTDGELVREEGQRCHSRESAGGVLHPSASCPTARWIGPIASGATSTRKRPVIVNVVCPLCVESSVRSPRYRTSLNFRFWLHWEVREGLLLSSTTGSKGPAPGIRALGGCPRAPAACALRVDWQLIGTNSSSNLRVRRRNEAKVVVLASQ